MSWNSSCPSAIGKKDERGVSRVIMYRFMKENVDYSKFSNMIIQLRRKRKRLQLSKFRSKFNPKKIVILNIKLYRTTGHGRVHHRKKHRTRKKI